MMNDKIPCLIVIDHEGRSNTAYWNLRQAIRSLMALLEADKNTEIDMNSLYKVYRSPKLVPLKHYRQRDLNNAHIPMAVMPLKYWCQECGLVSMANMTPNDYIFKDIIKAGIKRKYGSAFESTVDNVDKLNQLLKTAQIDINEKFNTVEETEMQLAKVTIASEKFDACLHRMAEAANLRSNGKIDKETFNSIIASESEAMKNPCKLLSITLGDFVDKKSPPTMKEVANFQKYAKCIKSILEKRILELTKNKSTPIDIGGAKESLLQNGYEPIDTGFESYIKNAKPEEISHEDACEFELFASVCESYTIMQSKSLGESFIDSIVESIGSDFV